MTYWILTEKKTVIARLSVSSLSEVDCRDPTVIQREGLFMSKVCGSDPTKVDIFPEIVDDPAEPYTSICTEAPTPEQYDEYISAQVMLPLEGLIRKGQVIRRKRDPNGNPMGVRNSNPLLDTREYDVLFPNGAMQSFLANDIAEGIYSQVDQEGRSFLMLSEIIDHEVDDTAIRASKGSKICTTKGWKLIVTWKDGTTTSVPLKEMKNLYPLETAENTINNKLEHEPAFAWWMPHVKRKKE